MRKRVKRVQALAMALILFLMTVISPLLNTVEVQAAEEGLKIMFHYNKCAESQLL